MSGGVIVAQKATGDVFFLSDAGKELMAPIRDVAMKIAQEFGGLAIDDAVEDARRYAIGAIQQKMAYKTRYQNCRIVVRNLRIDYKIKYGFAGSARPESG